MKKLLLLAAMVASATCVAQDGDLDTSFGGTGVVVTNSATVEGLYGNFRDEAYGMAVQADGKTVVVGMSVAPGSRDFVVARYNTNGTLDTTFGGTGVVTTDVATANNLPEGKSFDTAQAVAIDSLGRIVVAGFTRKILTPTANDVYFYPVVARYNTNGTLDATFGGTGVVVLDPLAVESELPDSVFGMGVAVQANNRIVFAGYGDSDGLIVVGRLTTAGVLDATFGTNGITVSDPSVVNSIPFNSECRVNDVAIDGLGRIAVVGTYGNNNFMVARYLSNGLLDATFGSTGIVISTGGLDPAEAFQEAFSVAIQPSNNEIVVAGHTIPDAVTNTNIAVARYNVNGALDTAGFGSPNGYVVTNIGTELLSSFTATNDRAYGVALQADNKIVVAGRTNATSGREFGRDIALVRYASNGNIDAAFGTNGVVLTNVGTTNALGFESRDFGFSVAMRGSTIMVAGRTDLRIDWASTGTVADLPLACGSLDIAVAAYDSSGILDSSFGSTGIVATDVGTVKSLGAASTDVAQALVVQPDDKIVIGGYRSVGMRNDTSGLTAPEQNDQTTAYIDASGLLAQEPTVTEFCIARYTTSGALDGSFGTNGVSVINIADTLSLASCGYAVASSVAIDGLGRIVLAGSSKNNGLAPNSPTSMTVARFTSSGVLDGSFGTSGIALTSVSVGSNDVINAVASDSTNRVVVAGSTNGSFLVARYTTGGTLDATFGTGGVVIGSSGGFNGLVIQPDGKIVAAGTDGSDVVVARYTTTGALDTTFNGTGIVTTSLSGGTDSGNAVTLQTDGDIVVAAAADTSGSTATFAVIRYNSNGTLDTDFNGSGIVLTNIGAITGYLLNPATGVVMQSDGKIVATGYSMNVSTALISGDSQGVVVRYRTDGSLDTTFGTNGIVLTNITTANNIVPGNLNRFFGVTLQTDGKIVTSGAAGYNPGFSPQFPSARGLYQNITVARYLAEPVAPLVTDRIFCTSCGPIVLGTRGCSRALVYRLGNTIVEHDFFAKTPVPPIVVPDADITEEVFENTFTAECESCEA